MPKFEMPPMMHAVPPKSSSCRAIVADGIAMPVTLATISRIAKKIGVSPRRVSLELELKGEYAEDGYQAVLSWDTKFCGLCRKTRRKR